jgi:hypothetical protein
VRVLRTAGTPDGYVEGFDDFFLTFGWKQFSSIKIWTPPSFVKPFDLPSGTSVRSTVDLILMRKCFNYFNL